MCSIFGYVGRGISRPSVETLAAIVRANVQRGPHSFGLAWVAGNGRLHCFKQRGRMTDHLGVLAMVRDATMVVGHLRFATHGDPDQNINNHPHPSDGGWIVHNGVVRNYAELVRDHGLPMVSECDSESLGLMIERSAATGLLGRCADAVDASTGNLCLMGLWPRPAALVVARRGNPLHVSDTVDGVYLATLRAGLPGRAKQVGDGTLRAFRRTADGTVTMRRGTLAAAGGEWTAGVGRPGGGYAGG